VFRRFWYYSYEGSARKFFKSWFGWASRSRLKAIMKVAKMLKRHFENIITYLRHPDAVRALFLMRLTGGEFAAGRLPEMYYGQFIRAAREGGMAAVCATEQYRERIAANPGNRERLMRMDPERYIEVMSNWLAIFTRGPVAPMYGVTAAQLGSIKVPSVVIPGNDKTHSMACGRAIQKLIPNSRLVELPLEDQDVPLIPFPEWAPHEETIARVCAEFILEGA